MSAHSLVVGELDCERPGDNVTEENKGAEPQKDAKEEDTDSGDLATSSFMSFEEWKEMQLRKAGQDPAELKARKQQEGRGDGYINSGHGDLDSLGDDAEIALDFDVLSDKISEISASTRPSPSSVIRKDIAEEPILYDDGMAQYPRPKDAGKTCKERFSFSSFDGGATVLKTSPGAKNSKAILLENKDSYMLFTCSQQNKFVIVELSEDILVDTVVLANFEFFSSMVRLFRVSVSDRYPVKIDKWKDIGTFEARNSRDLQPFLVENPKIWAKYIRIEFLTHYGNEYYCPISLLRVHGTRMLDSWKDAEGSREEDEAEETISGPELVPEQEPLSNNKTAEPKVAPPATTDMNSNASEAILEMGLSPWYPTFYPGPLFETCATGTPTTTETVRVSPPVEEMTNMESFFKTVSKRLQLLESNTTLSLQYIEDQSKFLQEALQKMERKQISRVDSFLDNLNKTVLSELHNVRQQYDQIWQSTVIALETQREQSQREVVALTSRLNLLADEVVFQKRMAILQSVLLLACLLLVIFSRGLVGNTIDLAFPQMLGNTNLMTPTPPSAPVEGFSSPESPTPLRNRVAHSTMDMMELRLQSI
ncbi:putative sad1 unc domain-containing protein [Phaeoacremonium minimum UCRPA7]|uniref:Putative sad1 unc domain-containing protein n=1 Tax=Phaeoacremonium minimum (strain UCR-PA7) TaxID=1286976 RepID=R8BUU8_PHAM7|nr:putative sad1 unc domain-containing protein [Phaeoacremonium minimum UCRPA7]EOO03064.1 putative sad1 unc domain-containing protein [Phaeoacremonium minimum UCRPA7]